MGQPLEVDPAAVLNAAAVLQAEYQQQIEGFDGLVEPDITLSAHGLQIARVNAASGARFARGRADARIDDVVAWFEARRLPFVWQIGPRDRPKDLGERLLAHGFRLDPEEMPGMARSLRDLPTQVHPDDAAIEVVRDGAAFRTWIDVAGEGFGMPPAIPETLVKYEALGFDDALGLPAVLARLDGRPVATALGVVAGGGVAIANVTTLEAVRGRGIGRAVTLAVMKLALDMGAEIAVLLATEMGFSVYRGLGFETFAKYRSYTWDPSKS